VSIKELKEINHSSNQAAKFLDICSQASQQFSKALSSDKKIILLCNDCDNLGAAVIIYFLISIHKWTFSQAYGFVKERRLTTNLIDL
jgi:hypothetical protein